MSNENNNLSLLVDTSDKTVQPNTSILRKSDSCGSIYSSAQILAAPIVTNNYEKGICWYYGKKNDRDIVWNVTGK